MAHPDLRLRLQQRLVIDDAYVSIDGLARERHGEPRLLEKIRSPLRLLANGGPFVRWFDDSADRALRLERLPHSPQELVRAICNDVQHHSMHIEHVEDDYERFFARITIAVRERLGLEIPQLSDSKAIWCRQFATAVSRAYAEIADREPRFSQTAVLFIMGVPSCDASRLGLHAWNWLVDFEQGCIWAFDPQNENVGRNYANVSSLLYTCAALRAEGQAVPGLRPLVRRHESVYGGTTLFHLARHPIDRASRHAIMARLQSSRFERVIPTWRDELEECDDYWGNSRVNVAHIVGYADQ